MQVSALLISAFLSAPAGSATLSEPTPEENPTPAVEQPTTAGEETAKPRKLSLAPAIGGAVASGVAEVVFVASSIGLSIVGGDVSSPVTEPRFWAGVGLLASLVGVVVGPTLVAYGVARFIASLEGAPDPDEIGWHAGEGDLLGAVGGGIVGATLFGALGAFALGALGAYVGATDGVASSPTGVVGAIGFGIIGAIMGSMAAAPGLVAGAVIGRPIGAFNFTKKEIDRQSSAASEETAAEEPALEE